MMKRYATAAVIVLVAALFSCKQSVSTATLDAGKKVYTANCAGCHMDNGKGVPRMNPAIDKSPYVMGDPGSLVELILKGSAFFGNANRGYHNEMASFRQLSDEDIASLATYLRNHFATTGDEVSAEKVANVRAKLQ